MTGLPLKVIPEELPLLLISAIYDEQGLYRPYRRVSLVIVDCSCFGRANARDVTIKKGWQGLIQNPTLREIYIDMVSMALSFGGVLCVLVSQCSSISLQNHKPTSCDQNATTQYRKVKFNEESLKSCLFLKLNSKGAIFSTIKVLVKRKYCTSRVRKVFNRDGD